jgi:hypothetical protein
MLEHLFRVRLWNWMPALLIFTNKHGQRFGEFLFFGGKTFALIEADEFIPSGVTQIRPMRVT